MGFVWFVEAIGWIQRSSCFSIKHPAPNFLVLIGLFIGRFAAKRNFSDCIFVIEKKLSFHHELATTYFSSLFLVRPFHRSSGNLRLKVFLLISISLLQAPQRETSVTVFLLKRKKLSFHHDFETNLFLRLFLLRPFYHNSQNLKTKVFLLIVIFLLNVAQASNKT